jgi:biotin operon repressor
MDTTTRLTPTQRLMMIALRAATHPLSLTELAVATDSTAATVMDCARDLRNAGLVVRVKQGTRTHYTLPTLDQAQQ